MRNFRNIRIKSIEEKISKGSGALGLRSQFGEEGISSLFLK
jgi:hypothetical protein